MDTLPRIKLREQSRWGKLTWLPYETLIALLLIISGLFTLLDPEIEDIGVDRPTSMVVAIAVAYMVSGLAMVWGLWKDHVKAEVIGQLILVNAVLTSTFASILYKEPEVFKDNLVFLIVLFAAGVRLHQIFTGRRMVQVELETEDE